MTKTTSQCRRCGRTLTDPKSIARSLGRTCAKRVADAALVIIAKHSATQVDKAIELIGDGGIVRISKGTFTVVSSRGDQQYTTTPIGCTCTAGVYGRTCYHRVAAELISAA